MVSVTFIYDGINRTIFVQSFGVRLTEHKTLKLMVFYPKESQPHLKLFKRSEIDENAYTLDGISAAVSGQTIY
jgi:hypothetical protein